jgi:hypothetical protein
MRACTVSSFSCTRPKHASWHALLFFLHPTKAFKLARSLLSATDQCMQAGTLFFFFCTRPMHASLHALRFFPAPGQRMQASMIVLNMD